MGRAFNSCCRSGTTGSRETASPRRMRIGMPLSNCLPTRLARLSSRSKMRTSRCARPSSRLPDTLGSFRSAFGHWNVGLSFGVSVVVTLSGIALTLLVCSLCAYAFAYLEFPFRRVLFAVILGTMMLPMTTMIVPFYRVVRSLGISNSLLGLVIPYSVSAFGVFLLRQYYIKIPRSLMESAKTEGAGHLRIWWSIILPLSRPALAALAIVQFRAIWNDFLFPMIILKSDRLYTLPIRIQVMDSQNFNKPYEAIISAGFITALVPMVFFLLFQRHFIEGLAGGTKE